HGVEPCLDGPRCLLAIADRHLLEIAAIYTNVQNRTSFAAANPEFDEVKSERVKFSNHNAFQCLLHVDSVLLARTKKCGENFPHIPLATIKKQSIIVQLQDNS